MKVVLVNPPFKKPVNQKYERYFVRAGSRWPHSSIKRIGEIPPYVPFPFFLAYTAAILRENGFSIGVLDGVALDMDSETFLKALIQKKPDVILFETTTPTIQHDFSLIRTIKKESLCKIVLCGPHATVFSRDLLKNPDIECIVLGEYEFAALEVMQAIRDGSPLHRIKGVVSKDHGEISGADRAPLIDPLDRLPLPARDVFPDDAGSDMSIYWDPFCQRRPAVQVHASRGCPYRCYFCLWNQVMYNCGKYRLFSPRRVVDEIEIAIRKYGAREIYFDDDDFTISKKHVLEICGELRRRQISIKWSCMGDAINLDEEMIHRMSEAGCSGIKFGVESGSPRILEKLGKPVDLKRVKRITRSCARHDIRTHATFIAGLLGETKETLHETIRYLETLSTDTIQVSICTPFPGTALYDKAVRLDLLQDESWHHFDGRGFSVLKFDGLSQQELSEYRQRLFKKWLLWRLTEPGWIVRQIKHIVRSITGQGTRFFFGRIFVELLDEFKLKDTES